MSSTINVNLRQCVCFGNYANIGATPETVKPVEHNEPCRDGSPVLIPLPLDVFRSATFTVALGECMGIRPGGCLSEASREWFKFAERHRQECPARPVQVECSITSPDGTWEKSEVTQVERLGGWALQQEEREAMRICRDRLALVKALVLGRPQVQPDGKWLDAPTDLFTQRDAVYAALADMARAEDAAIQAQRTASGLIQAFDPERTHRGDPGLRPSAGFLDRYVERLIEQVGAL